VGAYGAGDRPGGEDTDANLMKKILISPQYLWYGQLDRQYVTSSLSTMLLDRGHVPVMASFHTEHETKEEGRAIAERYLDVIDPAGIIFQGGHDISPKVTGSDAQHVAEEILFRDYFEMGLLEAALERGLPVLGICRGIQLINVCLGGTLYEDLHSLGGDTCHAALKEGVEVLTNVLDVLPSSHGLHLEDGGVLRSYYGVADIEVNTFHHQAVKDVAEGLLVEARAPDGLIEAVSDHSRGILGVQWHPEAPTNGEMKWEPLDLWLSWLG